ncbi:MAG: sulfite exporter TauE/SafE family protein [Acidimicrobiia bacterium]
MRVKSLTLGLAAGIIGGLFGVGGGLLVVPGLVLWLGFDQRRASGTSLAVVVGTSAAASARLAGDGSVEFDVATVVFIGAIIGVWLGVRATGLIPSYWLARGFVSIMLASAIRLAFFAGDSTGGEAALGGAWEAVVLIGVGVVAGMLSSTLGVGGGVIYVPALVTLIGLEQIVAQGTSLAVILPTALLGSILHGRAGRVDWKVAMIAGTGAALGALGGAEIALGLSDVVRRRLFAAFLMVVAVRMLSRTRANLEN